MWFIRGLQMMVMVWALACGIACTGESDKDPTTDDTDTTGVPDTDLPGPCGNVQFVQEANIVDFEDIDIDVGVGGSQYGYATCVGAGWTCVGAHGDYAPDALNGVGSLTCFGPDGTETKFLGNQREGALGIKCRIVVYPDTQEPRVLTSAQYADSEAGDSVGKMYVLPLVEGASAIQDPDGAADFTVSGVVEDAYTDVEFVSQTLIDGTQTDTVCIGSSSPDPDANPDVGGLYCLSAMDFSAIPWGHYLVTDLEGFGAVRYGNDITAGLGTPEWLPYVTIPLTGGRIAVGDSRFDSLTSGVDAGLMTVFDAATGARQFAVAGSFAGARLGVAAAELRNGTGTVLLSTAPIGMEYKISDLTPGATTTDLGTGTLPQIARDWGMSVATLDYCGEQYVFVGAISASKARRNSPQVGAVYIYTASELIVAAAQNSEPTELGSVFGEQGAGFGMSINLVQGATPLETTVLIGAPNYYRTYALPFGSLLQAP